jgi:hypothetical protein
MGSFLDCKQEGMWPPYLGSVQGALVPAPIVGDCVSWMKRPLSAGEVMNTLKGFPQSNDSSLSSHSLKATALVRRRQKCHMNIDGSLEDIRRQS